MDEKSKKRIAPIIITILVVAYYILYFGLIIEFLPFTLLKIVFAIVPLILSGIMIYVCVERINEINGGEEDDLSKY